MNSEFVDFKKIRSYAGSQHRAFEELSYQLIASYIDRSTWRITRSGSPDAGLEWYATNSNGEVHGWQAKYIFGIEDLLAGMTDSLRTVVSRRPDVTKLTFVIPWNLPDGRPPRGKSARQKYTDKVKSWRMHINGAEKLEIDLLDESELLNLLVLPEHRGRSLFFWNQQILGNEHLRRMHTEASRVAGRRYRPELQVDLPIQSDIDALGLGGTFFSELDTHLELLAARLDNQHSPPNKYSAISEQLEATSQQVITSCQAILRESAARDEGVAAIPQGLDRLKHLASDADRAISLLSDAVHEASKARQATTNDTSSDSPRAASVSDLTYGLRRLADPVNDLLHLLSDSRAELIAGKPYFLSGDAGSGKTHLLLDACDRALKDDRPAAVLFGEQFGTGNFWSQLASSLGLTPNLSQAEVLGVLDSCGELNGKRFVLAIDALNDTQPISFWTNNLLRLVSAIEHYPHVALAVSIRTTYIHHINQGGRSDTSFLHREHPGFMGRETEATQLYFDHYKLETPRHPILRPDFTNPMFLQLYCESFQDYPTKQHEYESRIAVFDRLIDGCVMRVARRLTEFGSTAETSLIADDAKTIIYALLDVMASEGQEKLTIRMARDAVSSCGVPEERAMRLLSILEAEGLFSTCEIWLAGSHEPGIRISFQAFGDYLILNRKLDCRDSTMILEKDTDFAVWLLDASSGIQEAAAVILPERHNVELRDYLQAAARQKFQDPIRLQLQYERFDSLTLNTLSFRTAGSITDHTIAALDRTMQSVETRLGDFYSKMCMVAPLPGHPLNALSMHDHLARMSMAERDASFGIEVYDALHPGNSFWRLAAWARNGPYDYYDEEVIELATIPLIWLLGSPNRFMRDWLTKVLVRLLAGHTQSLLSLIRRFATINDDYIRERLIAIVYGVLMRCQGSSNGDDLKKLIIETSRCYLETPIANALALDHLEGIIDFGLAYKIVPPNEVSNHKIPYGLPLPDHPWRFKRIDNEYGHDSRHNDEPMPYYGIFDSMFGLADFGRYVVDSCFSKFTIVRRDESPPSNRRRTEWKLDKRKLSRVLKTADPELIDRVIDVEGDETRSVPFEVGSPEMDLYLEILACRERDMSKEIDYPTGRARRWIFMRAIKHGWTPERFETFERWRTGHRGHIGTHAERFGKKYQWLAYFELLARIRDHYHPMPSLAVDAETDFQALWDSGDRQIDPSIPPVPHFEMLEDRRRDEDKSLSSSGIVVSLDKLCDSTLDRYMDPESPDILTDFQSLPSSSDVVEILDDAGDTWLVLTGYGASKVKEARHRFGMLMDQASIITACLVPAQHGWSASQELLDRGPEWRGLAEEIWDRHGHSNCCYLGEIGWRDQGCYHRRVDFMDVLHENGTPIQYLPLSESYLWEAGSVDGSIADSIVLYTPPAWIVLNAEVSWDGNLTWIDDGGSAVIANIRQHRSETPYALVYRKNWLTHILSTHDLNLIVRCWTERRDFRDDPARPYLFSSSIALFDQSFTLLREDRVSGNS